MPEARKLATILALDVARYSKAAERDDSAAVEAVRRLRAAIVEIAQPFGGRIFSSAGDGFMLEFPSAVAGVQAAMALLKDAPARELPEIRIGVHLGDVIVEENGNLMGHGVNVAARLQALAEPGSAVVSEAVRSQVRSAAALPFTPHGRVQLDKMSERIAVYSLAPGATPLFAGIARRQAMGVGVILAALVLLGAMAFAASTLLRKPAPGLVTTVSLYQDEEAHPAVRRLTRIGFIAERNANDRLSIRADFPYRDRLENEHRVDGLVFNNSPFIAGLPKVLIQVTNTTASPITINEVQFEVLRAAPNQRPLLTVRERAIDVHKIIVFNEGWGEAENLELTIDAWGLPEEASDRVRRVSGAGVESYEPCAQPSALVTPADRAAFVAVADPGGAFVFDTAGRIPRVFDGARFVCAVGALRYRANGRDVQLALRTRVSNRRPDVSIAPVIGMTYDLYLDPARHGYVAIVPALREIAPGETANIALTVLSERSSTFVLRPSVRAADGAAITADTFELEVVIPRTGGRFVLNEERRLAVPTAAITAEDLDAWIETASYDPQGREPVRFNARSRADEATCVRFLNREAQRIPRRAGVAQSRVEIVYEQTDVLCDTREG